MKACCGFTAKIQHVSWVCLRNIGLKLGILYKCSFASGLEAGIPRQTTLVQKEQELEEEKRDGDRKKQGTGELGLCGERDKRTKTWVGSSGEVTWELKKQSEWHGGRYGKSFLKQWSGSRDWARGWEEDEKPWGREERLKIGQAEASTQEDQACRRERERSSPLSRAGSQTSLYLSVHIITHFLKQQVPVPMVSFYACRRVK